MAAGTPAGGRERGKKDSTIRFFRGKRAAGIDSWKLASPAEHI
jgi:hypothetical protein